MNKITFTYIGKYAYDVCLRPVPSSAYIPEWHKQMDSYVRSDENPSGTKMLVRDSISNATAKKCIPMLDGIMSGYTVPLWSDVQITQSEFGPLIDWRVSKKVFDLHGNSASEIIPPPGFSKSVFKYITWMKVKTPPGYSIMVRPPAGHYDLPFQAIPAIIDTDKSVIDSNFPIWVRDDFEGIVEKGTPMVQIFPFKRENWKSEFKWITKEQHTIEEDIGFSSNIVNNYKKHIWTKKIFK